MTASNIDLLTLTTVMLLSNLRKPHWVRWRSKTCPRVIKTYVGLAFHIVLGAVNIAPKHSLSYNSYANTEKNDVITQHTN